MAPVKCYLCDKSFKSEHALNGHKKAHTRMCPYCGEKFSSRYGVYAHLKVHYKNLVELEGEADADDTSDTSDTDTSDTRTSDTDTSASGESVDKDDETPSTTCSGDESFVVATSDESDASDATLYHARPPAALQAVFDKRDEKATAAGIKYKAEYFAKQFAKHAKKAALGKCEPSENEIDVHDSIDESSSNRDSEESEGLDSSFIALSMSADEEAATALEDLRRPMHRFREELERAKRKQLVVDWLKETNNKKKKRAASGDDANSDHEQPSTSTGKKARF